MHYSLPDTHSHTHTHTHKLTLAYTLQNCMDLSSLLLLAATEESMAIASMKNKIKITEPYCFLRGWMFYKKRMS